MSAARGPIRLLLADDHPVVRDGLRGVFADDPDFEVVGEAGDGAAAVEAAAALQPDVVLLDLKMPGMDGIDALRLLRERAAGARVLVVTSFADEASVVPALRSGAAGYVYKDIDPQALAQAVRTVHAGQVLLHPEIAQALLAGGRPGPARAATLTERERDVLAELARGRSNREIAGVLLLSEKTVKTHVSSILTKLGLADRTQAALYAVRNGLAPR
jgi:DNA-binding NarL/FixJ family response regulator